MASFFFHRTLATARPQNFLLFLPAQHPPNAPCIFTPFFNAFRTRSLLHPALFLLFLHPLPESAPDDRRAGRHCTDEGSTEGPVGQRGGTEAHGAYEDAEVRAGGVGVVREAVQRRARWPRVRAYERRERARVKRDRRADDNAPRQEEEDA
jgi:hypothetical protein